LCVALLLFQRLLSGYTAVCSSLSDAVYRFSSTDRFAALWTVSLQSTLPHWKRLIKIDLEDRFVIGESQSDVKASSDETSPFNVAQTAFMDIRLQHVVPEEERRLLNATFMAIGKHCVQQCLEQHTSSLLKTFLGCVLSENDEDVDETGDLEVTYLALRVIQAVVTSTTGLGDGDEIDRSKRQAKVATALKPLLNQVVTHLCSMSQLKRRGVSKELNMKMAMYLQIVAAASEIMRARFQPLLMSSLYFLLDLSSHTDAVVSHNASTALHRIAWAVDQKPLSDVLVANCDYIVDSLTQALRYSFSSSSYSRVYRIVNSLLVLCPAKGPILLQLRDFVSILIEHLATTPTHSDEAASLLISLLSIVDALSAHTAEGSTLPIPGSIVEKKDDPESFYSIQKIKERLSRLHNFLDDATRPMLDPEDLELEEDDEEDSKMDTKGDNARVEEEESKLHPYQEWIEIGKNIALQCRHFLSSNSIEVRNLVLRIISQALLVVRLRESDLLPLLAQLWPSIRSAVAHEASISSHHRVYTTKLAGALESVVVCAPQFMSKRFDTDLWPLLQKLLQSQLQSTKKTTGFQDRTALPHVIIQEKLLRCLGSVVEAPGFRSHVVSQLVSLANSYVADSTLPESLHSAAGDLLKKLSALQPDYTWAKLQTPAMASSLYDSSANLGSYHIVCPQSSIPATNDRRSEVLSYLLSVLEAPMDDGVIVL